MSDVNATPSNDDDAARVNVLLADINPATIDDSQQVAEYLGQTASTSNHEGASQPLSGATPAQTANPSTADPASTPAPGTTRAEEANLEANTIGVADEPLHADPEVADAPERDKATESGDDSEPKRKPVFDKAGYELPKSVSAIYVARDGKFVDRKSERVHFEDTGKKLSTTSEDRRVIESMVEIAKAKNWDHLELRGSEEFRRQAWLAAELAGIGSRGYKPNAQDHATLQARREEMRISGGEKAKDNSISVDAATRTQDKGEKAPENPDRDLTERQRAAMAALTSIYEGRGTAPETVEKALSAARSRLVDDRVHVGRVIEHGAAPYDHNPDNALNYYVRLETAEGERTVWGVDLERSAELDLLQIGEDVLLVYRGKEAKKVLTPRFDVDGRVTAEPSEITTRRNTWHVLSLDKLPELNQAVAPSSDKADTAPAISDEDEARLRAEWPPERIDQLRAELEADRQMEMQRRAQETIEKFKDPAYREANARELLLRAGRSPEEIEQKFGIGAKPLEIQSAAQSSVEDPKRTTDDLAHEAVATSNAKEAALRAVLEQEMQDLGLPEEDRRAQRANLNAVLEHVRASGKDLGRDFDIPDPLTIDRSAHAVSQSHAHSIEQTPGNSTPELSQ